MELSLPTSDEAWVGWTLPPPNDGSRGQIEAFASLLSGPHGIVSQELADNEFVTDAHVMLYDRGLVLVATPVEGVTLERAEQELAGVMQRLADGAIPREVWRYALERLPLDASHWARSNETLSRMIAESFVHHRQWAEVAASLRPMAPSRAAVSKLAAQLIERGRAVLYLRSGPPWSPGAESLPFKSSASRLEDDRHSELARRLLGRAASDVGSRFLSEGMHFERDAWGDGHLIMSPSEGPLFQMTVSYPMGIWHDPFVCDAIRARYAKWSADVQTFADADISLECGVEETRFHITGVTQDFTAVWSEMWRRLGDVELSDRVARDHFATELRWRAEARRSPDTIYEALGTYASMGIRSLDRSLPSDAELRSATPARLRRSLERLTGLIPDVLYAGVEPERIKDLLPEPPGSSEAPPKLLPTEASMLEQFDGPVVYVLDLPGIEQADGRVYLTWPTDEPKIEVFANLYAQHPGPAYEIGARLQVVTYGPQAMVEEGPRFRREFGWAYGASHDKVVDMLEGAVDDLVAGPARSEFAQAQDDLESRDRVERITGIEVPFFVRDWEGDIDPRLRRWTELRRIDTERFEAFSRKVAAMPPIMTVAGDVSRLDMARLQRLGQVIKVRPEEVLRDVQLTDSGWER